MSQVTLQIDGMSCSHCLNAVNRALNAVPGATVQSVEIGRAVVDLAPGVEPGELEDAVHGAGYVATAVARV